MTMLQLFNLARTYVTYVHRGIDNFYELSTQNFYTYHQPVLYGNLRKQLAVSSLTHVFVDKSTTL
jgi:hypothetical protein